MSLLLQVAERLSLSFFADGANVARTEAALAVAHALCDESLAVAATPTERRTADARSATVIAHRDVTPAREALSA